ncbi:LysR family transcriptional regulator [Embleya sp. NBC_00896]|uniref:LysR family transcriptional regulator n=1 Tax=Embleya sp. NBC_00896 TaxID=2975961 RepID=UPI00386B0334|nr:LysR family transcriptional regulator [Embleya sp. NBC_00896]
MELRHLGTFTVVAREGTLTGAAHALGMAQSSVADHVRCLERSLGLALFERDHTGMHLTEPGTRLLTWAHRLLDQAEQARRDVTGIA